MQILLFSANRIVLHAQFITNLIEQFKWLYDRGISLAKWGCYKLININVSKYLKIVSQTMRLDNALSGVI